MEYVRISDRMMYDKIVQTMLANRNKLTDLQQQISTGKRVDSPSDDPSVVMGILKSKNSLYKIDTYMDNIESAISEMEVTSQVIQSAVDIAHRAKELTVQASNATSGPEQLSAISYEIDQLTAQLKDLGNTQFQGRSIFGGLVTDDPAFVTPAAGEIQYNGTPSTGTYQRQVEVSQGVSVTINVTGDKVFGEHYMDMTGPTLVSSGFIGTLITLQQELTTIPPDYDNIRSKLDEIDNDTSNLLSIGADIGGTISRLDMTKSKLENENLTYTQSKSNLEDIDLAKAISDLSFQETSFQASLQVSARLSQLSLLNYL